MVKEKSVTSIQTQGQSKHGKKAAPWTLPPNLHIIKIQNNIYYFIGIPVRGSLITTDSDIGQDQKKISIEYRDTASIIGPSFSKLAGINKPSSEILAEATKNGFFDVHQTKSALDKLAVSLLKKVEGEEQ